jgi:uncharacterized membrane protein (DUF373 family)
MFRYLKKIENTIIISVIIMMTLVLILSTLDLAWLIATDIITPPVVLLSVNELLEIFGFFLLIIIGIELLETIKTYFEKHVIHAEVVLEVAIIAVVRKVIILDVNELPALTLIGIALIIAALAGAHYLLKRSLHQAPSIYPTGAGDSSHDNRPIQTP